MFFCAFKMFTAQHDDNVSAQVAVTKRRKKWSIFSIFIARIEHSRVYFFFAYFQLNFLSLDFQDVENSRSYIDDLYSHDDSIKIEESLVCLKNVVIGSDRQKQMVISQGIVPRLMAILSQENAPLCIRYDAAIVLGTFRSHTNWLFYHTT